MLLNIISHNLWSHHQFPLYPFHTFPPIVLSQPHTLYPFTSVLLVPPLFSGSPRFTYSFCFQEQDAASVGLSSPLCGVWQWVEAEAEAQEEAEFPSEDPARQQVRRERL